MESDSYWAMCWYLPPHVDLGQIVEGPEVGNGDLDQERVAGGGEHVLRR